MVGACTLCTFTVILTSADLEAHARDHQRPAAASLSWIHELPPLGVATSPIAPPERQKPAASEMRRRA